MWAYWKGPEKSKSSSPSLKMMSIRRIVCLMNTLSLFHIDEPKLDFRYNQKIESPKDGLYLFGPLDESHPGVIRAGVIGTP